MASVLRTSSPVDMDHDYTPNDRLHSHTKNSGKANCYPCDSRGRRLFPQRRPSIPTSVSHNVNATSDFSLMESSPSRNHSPIDDQEIDSTTSSPSSVDSVATVNVRVVSTSERPFSGTDPRVGEDARVCTPYLGISLCSAGWPITPHNPLNKSMETSFSAPLYIDAPSRGSLQWKSMAQFHELRRPLRPRESQSPEVNAHTSLVPTAVRQDCSREEDEHIFNRINSRQDVPALEIVTWDCTVKLSTIVKVTVTDSGWLQIYHLAVLSVIAPMGELHAERVSLSIVVTNAFRNNQKRSLAPGQSSLLFEEDVSQPGFFPREGAELVIERNKCDLEKPLNLYFAFTYPLPHHFLMVSLPTFRPKEGRLLSEAVFIAEPLPPLSMRTFIEDPLSSWKLCGRSLSQVTCYKRIEPPRLYPAAYQDDIQIRISELDPVRFRVLRDSALSSMLWKLDITIYGRLGEQLECRMNFFLEVGPATALVSLVPHGWVPRYFIVDDRVATEKGGECWENKEGHIKIFRQPHMIPGPIMVETYWQGPPKFFKHDGYSPDDLPLPQIADRKMLGGRLTCGGNEFVLLNHLGEKIRTKSPVDRTYTLLPTMDASYRIHLKSVTESPSPKSSRPNSNRPASLPIPEDSQPPEYTTSYSDTEEETGHDRALSHSANDVETPKMTLQDVLLSILILLWLIPAFLLFAGHVRNGNNHNPGTSMSDLYPSTTVREGENLEGAMDVVGLDPLQPAVPGADHPGEMAKCQGWRDWLDYGSGWKGCVP